MVHQVTAITGTVKIPSLCLGPCRRMHAGALLVVYSGVIDLRGYRALDAGPGLVLGAGALDYRRHTTTLCWWTEFAWRHLGVLA